ncbi:DUF3261 domain-containing protein [Thiotrichales bacterium 19S11-10]|nr:DUF3261 domain-containing protein [Thiotrichales bacterium 19S11-10]
MKLLHFILISMLALMLFGCSLFQVKRTDTPSVMIAPDVYINLPTPNTLDINQQAKQILTATYTINGKKDSYTSEVIVEITPARVILVAASGWGGTIFSINYDGKTIDSSSLPMPNANMGIKHTLSDFIFTYASDQVLDQMLALSGIKLVSKPKRREFWLDKKLIMSINYQYDNPWKGKVKLHNYLYHYTIDVETFKLEGNYLRTSD